MKKLSPRTAPARMSPDRPVLRGTAQNPDVYFQARETVNPFYAACPDITQQAMDQFAKLTGRQYSLFEYLGAPDAERVIVIMGSGCETAHDTVDYLDPAGREGRRLEGPALPAVRRAPLRRSLPEVGQSHRGPRPHQRTRRHAASRCTRMPLRPCSRPATAGQLSAAESSAAATGCLPRNSRRPWSRPSSTISRQAAPRTISRSASTTTCPTPALPVTRTSPPSPDSVVRALFYGLGADGTVGANKNSIKIIGEEHRQLRPGLFRLRLEEVGVDDHFAPAVRPAPDPRRPT